MNTIICGGALTNNIVKMLKGNVDHINIVTSLNSCSMLRDELSDAVQSAVVFSSSINSNEEYADFKGLLATLDSYNIILYFVCFKKDINYYNELVDLYKEAAHIQIELIDCLSVDYLKNFFKNKSSVEVQPQVVNSPVQNNYQGVNSGTINKGVYCVTGHSGVGKTDFLANSGYILSVTNVRTIIIDLDVISRGINLYYNQVTKFSGKEGKQKALLQALECPEEAHQYMTKINGTLDILGISYEAVLTEEELFANYEEKIINLIAYLKNYYEVILIELSFEDFEQYNSLFNVINSFILVMNNSIYSIYKTAGLLEKYHMKDPVTYDKLKYSYNLLINKFDKSNRFDKIKLTNEKSAKLLNDLLDTKKIHINTTSILPYYEQHTAHLFSDQAVKSVKPKHFKTYFKAVTELYM